MKEYKLEGVPKCVLVDCQPAVWVDGPYERDADGTPEWCVCFGGDDGEPLTADRRDIWYFESRRKAEEYGRFLASKYRLELVNKGGIA